MKSTSTETKLDLRRFKRQVKSSWWIFLVCFLFFMGTGVAFWFLKGDKYTSYARVLVEPKDGSGLSGLGQMMGMMKAFSIGGIGSSNTNNELMLMTSREVMDSTVQHLGLNYINIQKFGLRKHLLWGDEVQLKVDIPQQVLDTLVKGFKINVDLIGDEVDVKVTKGNRFFWKTVWTGENLKLPAKIGTPVGELTLSPSIYFKPEGEERNYMICVVGSKTASEELYKEVDIMLVDKMSDAVEYETASNNPAYNEAVLNQLIQEYSQKRLEQKNKDARDDVDFYDARLESLSEEMSDADNKLEKYKNDNKIVAIEAEAELLATSRVANKQEIAVAQAELEYYQRVLHTLKNDEKGMVALPTPENIENPMIEAYNDALIQKRQLEVSAKSDNPTLVTLNRSIKDMREALIKNITLVANSSEMKLKSLYGFDSEANSRLSKMPKFEREYVSLLRDKTVKDELYLFLMERRESALLDLSSTSTPAFVVDNAYTDVKPTRILKIVVLIACFLLSFISAVALVVWRMKKKDALKDKIDLSACGLEERCHEMTPEVIPASEVRIDLTKDRDSRIIYLVDMAHDATRFIDALADSFRKSGLELSLFDLSEDTEYAHDNDTLSNREYLQGIKSSLSANGYALIRVPNHESLSLLRNVVEEENAQVLLILEGDRYTRKYVTELIDKLPQDRIVVCLDKE